MRVLSAAVLGLTMAATLPPAAGATSYQTLYSFAGASDGVSPDAGLIADSAGNLYGTTESGGTSNDGTVFALTPPSTPGGTWTEKLLYTFTGDADGSRPQAALVAGPGGILYGTTEEDGATQFGTVFALSPPAAGSILWTKTILWNFTGGNDGGYPYDGAALIIDSACILYGTTLRGGTKSDGTAFMLKPPAVAGKPWTETVLHSFQGGKDGYFPVGGLLMGAGGALYGTTEAGGAKSNGTLFRLTPPSAGKKTWTKTTLHSFAGGKDGSSPYSTLIADATGALYGTTYFGGGSSACGSFGCGTVYRLSPPVTGSAGWKATILHPFQSGADSEYPEAGLVADASGTLYGTTFGAYPDRLGAAFKLTPPQPGATKWNETILHAFAGKPDGNSPEGWLLAGPGGVFYGTTTQGGGGGAGICGRGCGSIFSVTP
jgi:uncharacterized repeat protein (TIGR03803 family)